MCLRRRERRFDAEVPVRKWVLLAGCFLACSVFIGACTRSRSGEEETNARTTAIKGGANSSCWPQAVSLTTDTGAACGGVLIAPDKVLTAAHCFAPIVAGSLSVQVGFGPNGQGPNGGAPLTASTVY